MTPPHRTLELIRLNLLSHFDIVELTRRGYQEALVRVAGMGFRSGAIYDALIWQAAVKKKVQSFYTWNLGDFRRFADGKITVREP